MGELLKIELRDYQAEALGAVWKAWAAGVRRPAVVLPCGCGKTVIFGALCSEAAAGGGRPLILVDRNELVGQAVEKLHAVDPSLVVGVIQGSRDDRRGHVVVASVQTLSRINRLHRINPKRFNMIIADECHGAAADSWRRVLEYFGAFDPGAETLTVGFTATMTRTDKRGLGEIWQEVVFKRSTRWAIERGFLCPVQARTVVLPDLDLAKVKKAHGDFSDGDLGKAMTRADAGPLVAAAYLEHARDEAGELRRGICFTPTVETAMVFLQAFRDAGIPTELIIGETSMAERHAHYDATCNGTNKVLMSVMCLAVGFDLPCVEVAVMARPTKSKGLYQQQVGRALRLSPETGKTSSLILDVAGVTRLGLASLVDLGVDAIQGDQPLVADEDLDERGVVIPHGVETPESVEFVEVDPFEGVRKRAMKRRSAWLMTNGGVPFLPGGSNRPTVYVRDMGSGRWLVGSYGPEQAPVVHGDPLAFPEAVAAALDLWGPKPSPLGGEPSEKQLDLLARAGIDTTGMSKQDASEAISVLITSRKLDRAQF